MRPEELAEVRAWLIKAAHDLQAAEYLSQAEEPLLDIAVYHCQQAMEKGLMDDRPFPSAAIGGRSTTAAGLAGGPASGLGRGVPRGDYRCPDHFCSFRPGPPSR